jgi:hypothetical protein
MAALHRYVEHLVSPNDTTEDLKKLVTGIVEGETRVLAASMTIEQIFKERKTFKGKRKRAECMSETYTVCIRTSDWTCASRVGSVWSLCV